MVKAILPFNDAGGEVGTAVGLGVPAGVAVPVGLTVPVGLVVAVGVGVRLVGVVVARVGVAVRVGVAGVVPGTGMTSTCPAWIGVVVEMPLALARVATLTPKRVAIPHSVSPALTV
jgi:hypothetical protein